MGRRRSPLQPPKDTYCSRRASTHRCRIREQSLCRIISRVAPSFLTLLPDPLADDGRLGNPPPELLAPPPSCARAVPWPSASRGRFAAVVAMWPMWGLNVGSHGEETVCKSIAGGCRSRGAAPGQGRLRSRRPPGMACYCCRRTPQRRVTVLVVTQGMSQDTNHVSRPFRRSLVGCHSFVPIQAMLGTRGCRCCLQMNRWGVPPLCGSRVASFGNAFGVT